MFYFLLFICVTVGVRKYFIHVQLELVKYPLQDVFEKCGCYGQSIGVGNR